MQDQSVDDAIFAITRHYNNQIPEWLTGLDTFEEIYNEFVKRAGSSTANSILGSGGSTNSAPPPPPPPPLVAQNGTSPSTQDRFNDITEETGVAAVQDIISSPSKVADAMYLADDVFADPSTFISDITGKGDAGAAGAVLTGVSLPVTGPVMVARTITPHLGPLQGPAEAVIGTPAKALGLGWDAVANIPNAGRAVGNAAQSVVSGVGTVNDAVNRISPLPDSLTPTPINAANNVINGVQTAGSVVAGTGRAVGNAAQSVVGGVGSINNAINSISPLPDRFTPTPVNVANNIFSAVTNPVGSVTGTVRDAAGVVGNVVNGLGHAGNGILAGGGAVVHGLGVAGNAISNPANYVSSAINGVMAAPQLAGAVAGSVTDGFSNAAQAITSMPIISALNPFGNDDDGTLPSLTGGVIDSINEGLAYSQFRSDMLSHINQNRDSDMGLTLSTQMIDSRTDNNVGTLEDVIRFTYNRDIRGGLYSGELSNETRSFINNFRPAPVASVQTPPPPPPPPPAGVGDTNKDGVMSRSESEALKESLDRNNDGQISRAELGGLNGLIGTVNSAGNTTHIAGMQVVSQESVDRSNIQNDIRNLNNSNDPAKQQQADNLERFFATAENGGLTKEQRDNLVIATTLQNADFNNPDRANTNYLAQVAGMTPAERAQALQEAQFVAGLASSGMFGVGQQNRPIGYQPVTTSSSSSSSSSQNRIGSADTMERQATNSRSADTQERSVTGSAGGNVGSVGGGSMFTGMATSASIPSRLGSDIAAAGNITAPASSSSPFAAGQGPGGSSMSISQPTVSRSVNADALDRPTTPAVATVHDSRPTSSIQNSTPSSSSISRSVNADALDRPTTPAVATVHDSRPTSATPSASSPFAAGQGPGGSSMSTSQPATVRTVNADTAERIVTPAPVAALVVHDAFTVDPRLAEIQNNPNYSQSVRNQAMQAVREGDRSSSQGLLDWFNGAAGNVPVVHDAHTAPTSATATNEFSGIDPRIGAIQNASGYSQTVKNQAMQAVQEGDRSSASDLLAWFNGAAGNAPIVHDAFQAPNSWTPPAPAPVVHDSFRAPTTWSEPAPAPVVHDSFRAPTPAPEPAPVAAPAPPPQPAAPVLTALDHKINEIHASGYSPAVKTQAIAAVQGGNDSPVSSILAYINGGVLGAVGTPAPNDPRQNQIHAVNTNPFYSSSVKSQAIALINGGGYDTANMSDVMAYLNGGRLDASNLGLGATVPTSIPPAASSRTPSVIPAGGGSVTTGFRS